MRRGVVFFLLAAILLTVPVFADFGPKPQLIVRVENGPEELYYLDILREGKNPYSKTTVGGLKDSYTEEELAALDQELLEDFTAAVPEGWYACVVQGAMVWGNIDSEDGTHWFGYLGVPDICRILMVAKSGETFLSEPFDRQVLQSSATVDWSAKTVKVPPVSLGYAVQFLATFLPTLAIEVVLLLLFQLWSRRNGLVFLLVNLATQGGLTLWMSVGTVRSGTFLAKMTVFCFQDFLYDLPGSLSNLPYLFGELCDFRLVPAEIVIFLAETGLYLWLFRDCSKKRAALYALTANLCSFALGLYLAEPIWRFVVKTIL